MLKEKSNKFFNFAQSFAFTLAEILIVLGVIGIVAEITVPEIVSNVQNNIYYAQLKEAYAFLSQVQLSIHKIIMEIM